MISLNNRIFDVIVTTLTFYALHGIVHCSFFSAFLLPIFRSIPRWTLNHELDHEEFSQNIKQCNFVFKSTFKALSLARYPISKFVSAPGSNLERRERTNISGTSISQNKRHKQLIYLDEYCSPLIGRY